jgi:hypothetical protein
MMTRLNLRALVAYCHDIGMAAISFPIALWLRIGSTGFAQYPRTGWSAMRRRGRACGVVS